MLHRLAAGELRAWSFALLALLVAVSWLGPRPAAPELTRVGLGEVAPDPIDAIGPPALSVPGCTQEARVTGQGRWPWGFFIVCAPPQAIADAWAVRASLSERADPGLRLQIEVGRGSCAGQSCELVGAPWTWTVVSAVTHGDSWEGQPAGARAGAPQLIAWYQVGGPNLRTIDLARLALAGALGGLVAWRLRRARFARGRQRPAPLVLVAGLVAGALLALRPEPWGGATELGAALVVTGVALGAAVIVSLVARIRDPLPRVLLVASGFIACASLEGALLRSEPPDARTLQLGVIGAAVVTVGLLGRDPHGTGRAAVLGLVFALTAVAFDALASTPMPIPGLRGAFRPWEPVATGLAWAVITPLTHELGRLAERPVRSSEATTPLLLVTPEGDAARGLLTVSLDPRAAHAEDERALVVSDNDLHAPPATAAAASGVLIAIEARIGARELPSAPQRVRFEHGGQTLVGRSFELPLALAWYGLRTGRRERLAGVVATGAVQSDRESLAPIEGLSAKLGALLPGEILIAPIAHAAEVEALLGARAYPELVRFTLGATHASWLVRRAARRAARSGHKVVVLVPSLGAALRFVFG